MHSAQTYRTHTGRKHTMYAYRALGLGKENSVGVSVRVRVHMRGYQDLIHNMRGLKDSCIHPIHTYRAHISYIHTVHTYRAYIPGWWRHMGGGPCMIFWRMRGGGILNHVG
jgi:hypothetical protein